MPHDERNPPPDEDDNQPQRDLMKAVDTALDQDNGIQQSLNATQGPSRLSGYAPDGEPEPPPIFEFPTAISADEWRQAASSPPCIVENLLFQDLSLLSAGGGTGKTTLLLYEAVHIILELPLYGRSIFRPGPVMYVTAEDSRETIIARAREICEALKLSDGEIEKVRQGLLIKDISCAVFRLTEVARDVVEISVNTGRLIEAISGKGLTMLILDPLVSFGTGEARVNDSEHGIIMACRRIIRMTGVGIQLVHHVSQVSSREKHIDAYAARGGTALPDGCRTVRILHNTDRDNNDIPLILDGDQLMKMHIPKTTYAKPQGVIWLARTGYSFQWCLTDPERDPEEIAAGQQAQIVNFITHKFNSDPPSRFSKTVLSSQCKAMSMTRAEVRAGVEALLARGEFVEIKLPADERRGRKKYFLSPITPITPKYAKASGVIAR